MIQKGQLYKHSAGLNHFLSYCTVKGEPAIKWRKDFDTNFYQIFPDHATRRKSKEEHQGLIYAWEKMINKKIWLHQKDFIYQAISFDCLIYFYGADVYNPELPKFIPHLITRKNISANFKRINIQVRRYGKNDFIYPTGIGKYNALESPRVSRKKRILVR